MNETSCKTPPCALFLPVCPLKQRLPPVSSSTFRTQTKLHRRPQPRRRPRRVSVAINITATAAPSSSSTESNSNATESENTAPNAKLDAILASPDTQRYVLFGGKGGVGKTSTSAAAAIKCADDGLSTLIISTDPAHSLGDALQIDLSHGRITRVDDMVPLYAVESDPREAVDRFRKLLKSLTPEPSSEENDENGGSGGNGGWVEKLGLSQLSDVLQTIPPGADELIALAAVLDVADSEDDNPQDESDSDKFDMGIDKGDSAGVKFDRIIIDTAPTGHTLRMLTLPDFLDGILGQALRIRQRLTGGGGMSSVSAGVVGTVVNRVLASREKEIEEATRRVTKYKQKMEKLSNLLRNPSRTEFVVVSIATALAVAETKRLIDKLWDDGVWVRHIVINQLIPQPVPSSYIDRLRSSQAKHIAFASEVLADDYGLSISIVPRFDADLEGLYAIQSLSRVVFRNQTLPNYGELYRQDSDECQFVFVGGKGGVGKTSISTSMALSLAEQGFKTLVLSTDPAHSLGDCLQFDLSGGSIQQIGGNHPIVTGTAQDGGDIPLYALEIDSAKAVKEFQNAVNEYLAGDSGNSGSIGFDLAKRLGLDEFAQLLDNAPPGIDEVVALTRVLELIEYGDFQRVVIDTAPTGHTLRLLSLPEFLDSFLGKISALKSRIDRSLGALKSVFSGSNSDSEKLKDNVNNTAKSIDTFRSNMVRLSKIIRNNDICQFVIVTIPTALAMAESERLVKSLINDEIAVRNVVVNQVVPDSMAESYVNRVASQQDSCVSQLDETCDEWSITMVKVPFFDAEVRGIYGLRAMSLSLFSTSSEG